MVKFHFVDWNGKAHTKTARNANACSYSYEGEGLLVVRDYFNGNVVSKLNIPANWRMIDVERR